MGLAGLVLPTIAPKIAFAQSTSVKDVVVLIHLMGGADALTFCAPHGDPLYYQSRPTLAIPQPNSGSSKRAIDLDGYFGLPQPFVPLKTIFDSGDLGIIHAVGRENWTRSHFVAQTELQTDSPEFSVGGWVARHLASSPRLKEDAAFRGFSFSQATPPSMQLAQQVISTMAPSSYDMAAGYADDPEIIRTITRMYSRVKDDTQSLVRDSKRTIDTLKSLNLDSYISGAVPGYENTFIGNNLRYSAAMMKAEVGVEVLQIDWFGWDTHANQGSVDGAMDNMMGELARGLSSFYADMEASGQTNWTVVIMSEFGRQVAENGSNGTDHGTAGCILTMGPNVVGGIHTDWPGLEVENRKDGVDLKPTIDYRDVIGDLVQCRLQNGNVDKVILSREVSRSPQGYFNAA